jgi:hypothetical protein
VNPNDAAPTFVITAAIILSLILGWTVVGRFILKRIAIFLGCCALAAIYFFEYSGFDA